MNNSSGRPRGRRPGVTTLDDANQDKGNGILRCYNCGRKLNTHRRMPCAFPPSAKARKRGAEAAAGRPRLQ